MSTLVTGATGFLGGALTRELMRRGDRVRALVRPSSDRSALAGLDVELAPGDVTDRASLDAAMKGCDRVFHAAALVATWLRDRSMFDRVNVDGTRNVVEAALDAGVSRIIYTSTFLVLKPARHPSGGPGERPITEESRAGAEDTPTDYARTKRLAQEAVDWFAADGAPVVTVFPGTLFGPGRETHGNLIGDWIVRFLRGRFPGYLGKGDRAWSFAFIDDVARGHLLADEKGQPGRDYCLGGENASIRAFMEIVAEKSGRTPPSRCIPPGVAKCVALLEECRAALTGREPELTRGIVDTFMNHWPLDSGRATAELGYQLTPLREAIEKTLACIRADRVSPGT